jgi:hypothetical protein
VFERRPRRSLLRTALIPAVTLILLAGHVATVATQSQAQRPLFDDLALSPGAGMERLRKLGLNGAQVLAIARLATQLNDLAQTQSDLKVDQRTGAQVPAPRLDGQLALKNAARKFVPSFAVLVAASDQSEDLAPMIERHRQTFDECVRAQDFKAVDVLLGHFDKAHAELNVIRIAKSRVGRGVGSDEEKRRAAADLTIARALAVTTRRVLNVTTVKEAKTRAVEIGRYMHCLGGGASPGGELRCRDVLLSAK